MAALSQEAQLEQLQTMFEAHNAKFQTTASPQMLYQHFTEDLKLFRNLNITRCVFLGLGRPTRALITPKVGEADTEKQKQFKAAPLTQLVFLTNLLALLKTKHDINEAFVEVFVDNTIYAATEDSFLRSLSLIPVHSGNEGFSSIQAKITTRTLLFAPLVPATKIHKALATSGFAVFIGNDVDEIVHTMREKNEVHDPSTGKLTAIFDLYHRIKSAGFKRKLPNFEDWDWCHKTSIHWVAGARDGDSGMAVNTTKKAVDELAGVFGGEHAHKWNLMQDMVER